MSQPDNHGSKFPEHVFAVLNGKRSATAALATPAPEVRQPISETREPPRLRRTGVSVGTLLALMLISAGIGGLAWGNYGDKLIMKFGSGRYDADLTSSPSALSPVAVAANEEMLLNLVRDLQAFQKRTARNHPIDGFAASA